MASKKEILVVEDQDELRKLECLLLSSRGYLVEGVADGRAALDYMANRRPDLVLLDVMLPEVDGFEVCRQIKSNEETRHIPVIMVTAKTSPEDMARGEEAGANAYLTKPFKSAKIIENIQAFLG